MKRVDRAERKAEAAFEKQKCKTLADFCKLAETLGYKPGWALIQWEWYRKSRARQTEAKKIQ